MYDSEILVKHRLIKSETWDFLGKLMAIVDLYDDRVATGSGFQQPMRRAGWENARAGALRGTQRGWSTGIRA